MNASCGLQGINLRGIEIFEDSPTVVVLSKIDDARVIGSAIKAVLTILQGDNATSGGQRGLGDDGGDHTTLNQRFCSERGETGDEHRDQECDEDCCRCDELCAI